MLPFVWPGGFEARKGGSSPLVHTVKPSLCARPVWGAKVGGDSPHLPVQRAWGPVNQTPWRGRQ